MKVRAVHATKVDRGLVITIPEVDSADGEELKLFTPKSNAAFLEEALGNAEKRFLSHESVCLPNESPNCGLLFGSALAAWSAHVPLELSPDLCWYMITHEVAVYIKANTKECAHFFTDTPDTKKKITVKTTPATPWEERVKLFRPGFAEVLDPLVFQTFLPKFSTTDPTTEASLLVTFMDGVQAYFEYGIELCCGIPKVRLTGTLADWQLLERSVAGLADMFEGLRPYFRDLQGVIKTLTETVRSGNPDPEFWSSIVKHSFGSGPAIVTGWLSAFVAYVREPDGTRMRNAKSFDWRSARTSRGWDDESESGIDMKQLPMHVNKVPFELTYPDGTKENLHLVGGVLGVKYDEFLTPQLGLGVIKL